MRYGDLVKLVYSHEDAYGIILNESERLVFLGTGQTVRLSEGEWAKLERVITCGVVICNFSGLMQQQDRYQKIRPIDVDNGPRTVALESEETLGE